MALIVEDGTGKTDAQSYLSVAEADTYHTNHSASTSWSGALTAVKEKALRLATQYLDANYGYRWKGLRSNQTQALNWPRGYVEDNDGYAIDSDDIPQVLKDACAEIALKSLTDTLLPDLENAAAIKSKSESIGPLSESVEYMGGMSQIKQYTLVDRILKPILGMSNDLVRA